MEHPHRWFVFPLLTMETAMATEAAIIENIIALRTEADEARHLTSSLNDSASIADLFAYARALEAHADLLELGLRRQSEAA
jgi:hypothetical protein